MSAPILDMYIKGPVVMGSVGYAEPFNFVGNSIETTFCRGGSRVHTGRVLVLDQNPPPSPPPSKKKRQMADKLRSGKL